MAEEKKNGKTKDAKSGKPVPATTATGTPSAGKQEPTNPESRPEPRSDSGGHNSDQDVKEKASDRKEVKERSAKAKNQAEVKVTEVTDDSRETDSEATPSDAGSGGDVGSGPTGSITPEDVDKGGGNVAVMSGAAFTAGLVTGLLIGWFASG